jgi:hypothetical protein
MYCRAGATLVASRAATSDHEGAIHNISHNLSLRIFTIGSDTSLGQVDVTSISCKRKLKEQ